MRDRVIELLEQAKAYAVCGSRSTAVSCIEEAMAELKTPRWETPEQYKERTGKEWPDNWAVYRLYENNDGETEWFWEGYGHAKRKKQTMPIVIATEAGLPPDDWRPQCVK